MKKHYLLLPSLLLAACGGGSSNAPDGASSVVETPAPASEPEVRTHFFGASNGVNGFQLWKTDGTEAGTAMVKVINESGSADVRVIGSLDGKAIFTAKDGINGRELWVSDGTEAGTMMLKDINPGSANTSIETFSVVGNTLYFDAYASATGNELWKTDGTAAGTMMVKDINPGANSSNVERIVVLNSDIYFRAHDGVNGYQLWKSDGTEAGTVSIGAPVVPYDEMLVLDGTIYFKGYDNVTGAELWKSDGTVAGTVMVKDIFPGITESRVSDIVSMGGNIYFLAAESNAQGLELWRSDGTAAGTVLVKNINTQTSGSFNNNGSRIRYLTATNDKLFFTARPSSASTISELWVSDGTEAGTISLHSSAGSVSDIIVTQNGTYFDGFDATNGNELWKTDGTVAGTALLKDVVPGTGSSGFLSLGGYNYYETPSAPVLELSDGSILLAGYTPDKGVELWKTDGTAAGTVIVKDMNPDAGDGLDN